MEQITVPEQSTQLEKLAADALASGYGLNVALVYEDAETRRWCRDVFERATKVAGQQAIRATWWNISDLSAPGVLDGAVSTAMRADVIVVACRSAEDLPLPFYVWTEAWTAHRVIPAGALVALLAEPAQASTLRDYLSAAAHQGRMELILEERGEGDSAAAPAPEALATPPTECGTGDTEYLCMAFAA